MDELISRWEVKKAFEDRFIELQKIKNTPGNKSQEGIQLGINWCLNKLAEIETVEERKQGEWISDEIDLLHCSICHKKIFTLDKFNYCPHCGADMRDKHTEFIEPKSNPDLPFG